MFPVASQERLATVAFWLLCLSWGSTYVAIKQGLEALPPFFYAGLRFALAGLVLGVWMFFRGNLTRLEKPDWLRVVPASLFMITVNYGLLNWGIERVDSGLSAVVNLATVAISMLGFSLAYRQEPFAWTKAVGIGTGVLGLGLLLGPSAASLGQQLASSRPAEELAIIAIALGSSCYSWGTVLVRPVALRHPAITMSAVQMMIGGIGLLALGGATETIRLDTWRQIFAPTIFGSLMYLVVVGSLLGFTLYQYLLKRWPSSRVALYTFVSPVIAVMLGSLLFGETITGREVGAAFLMLFGAYVAGQLGRAGVTKKAYE